jgi:hypothetical protein
MSPLSLENIESELSYAYLHAVASHAGASCKVAGRHEDNAGVDATLVAWGPFPGAYRNEIDLKVQLKATVSVPAEVSGSLAYNLRGIPQYDDLRSEAVSTPRILVVLFLPPSHNEWITHTDEALLLHKCAYWVSLRGASASANKTSHTVYLPKAQRFDAAGLRELFARVARQDVPTYHEVIA